MSDPPSYRPPSWLSAKPVSLLLLWFLALGLSALLVAAGRHWSAPLPPHPAAALAAVLLPPLVMAAWLLNRWRLPAAAPPAAAGSRQAGESCQPAQERI